jgi:hypothetical protein
VKRAVAGAGMEEHECCPAAQNGHTMRIIGTATAMTSISNGSPMRQ